MAQIHLADGMFTLALSRAEKIQAFHSDISVPLENVVSVEPTTDIWSHIRGVRAPGTGVPRIVLLATMRFKGGREFCALYFGKPGVIVTLSQAKFARLLVSTETWERALDIAHEVTVQRG